MLTSKHSIHYFLNSDFEFYFAVHDKLDYFINLSTCHGAISRFCPPTQQPTCLTAKLTVCEEILGLCYTVLRKKKIIVLFENRMYILPSGAFLNDAYITMLTLIDNRRFTFGQTFKEIPVRMLYYNATYIANKASTHRYTVLHV